MRIAYEDEHLLVVDKPAGLVVHPASGHATGTLVHALVGVAGGRRGGAARHRAPARPRHVRADGRREDGAGVRAAAVARPRRASSSASTSRSCAASRSRCAGASRRRSGATATTRCGTRSTPTRRATRSRTSSSSSCCREHALLRVRLETGRTHQIRVHLAAIELPVSGDRLYGVKGDLGLERQFLHAARLAFPHPITGEPVDVESPLPADLASALERARSG